MILYMFQCHSLKSSHPLPLPLPKSPKTVLYTCVSFAVLHITWRMVQDLRIINEAVVSVHPTVSNPYVILGEIPPSAKLFTVLDLKDAFFFCISSVQFSHSVLSDSLPPHELQHARPPCPSPTPRAYSNSCPLSC